MCMACLSVREDNPRALASGLSPVQTHTPYNNFLIANSMHSHFVHCEMFHVKHWNFKGVTTLCVITNKYVVEEE